MGERGRGKHIAVIISQKKRELFRRVIEIDKMAQRNIWRMEGKRDADNNIYDV